MNWRRNMKFSDIPNDLQLTPQVRHRRAAEMCEKAAKHHQSAARLHEAGDSQAAATHADIARMHSVYALAVCDDACEL
jgi:hypothetical protein